METILINKEKLLTKMRDNRTKHEQEYKKAMIGWKDQIHTKLCAILEKIQTDKDFDPHITLPKPSNHLKDYDATIDQIEWHEENIIELNQNEFNQFVRDDWRWKLDFESTNNFYKISK